MFFYQDRSTLFQVFVMSSTPLFGVFGEFDLSTELFTAYLERLEQYFIANAIRECCANATEDVLGAEDKKKWLCLFLLWAKMCVELCDLCSPDSPEERSFSLFCQQNDWKCLKPIAFINVLNVFTENDFRL